TLLLDALCRRHDQCPAGKDVRRGGRDRSHRMGRAGESGGVHLATRAPELAGGLQAFREVDARMREVAPFSCDVEDGLAATTPQPHAMADARKMDRERRTPAAAAEHH